MPADKRVRDSFPISPQSVKSSRERDSVFGETILVLIKCFPRPDKIDIFEPVGDRNCDLLALKSSSYASSQLSKRCESQAEAFACTRSPVRLDEASFVVLCGSITYFLADPSWKLW
jgi:hypothetical protein